MTPITALGSRYGIQGALGRSVKRASAASTWWDLNGTITSCVAAYQPKGAASLAASKVNLANPGTYNATAGSDPTFNSATGWTGTTSAYLLTGITPSTGWSMIVRFSNASNITTVCGSRKAANDSAFYIMPVDSSNTDYGNQGVLQAVNATSDGVLATAGQTAYKNGISVGTIPTATNTQWYEIYLLCRNTAGSPTRYFNGGVLAAVAIYNTTLTSTQISALNTAMAAL